MQNGPVPRGAVLTAAITVLVSIQYLVGAMFRAATRINEEFELPQPA